MPQRWSHSQRRQPIVTSGWSRDLKRRLILLTRHGTVRRRLAFRPPDPSCNAYLAFSAMLLAGLDGIQNRIDPGDPLEKDIYDLSPEELKDVPTLPGSLDESLKALEADHDFLLKGDVFSQQLIDRWINYKRDKEITPLRMRPHPLEFSLYFDI